MSNQPMIINVRPGEEITIMLTIRAVPESPKDEPAALTLKEIADRVCKANGVTFEQLASGKRNSEILAPRFLFCYIAYRLYDYNSRRVGLFLNKNHSSILYACNEFENMKDTKHVAAMEVIRRTQQLFPIKIS